MTEPRRRPRERNTRPDRSGVSARAARGAARAGSNRQASRPEGRPATRRTVATSSVEGGSRWWRPTPGPTEIGSGGTGGLKSRLVRQIAVLGATLVVVAVLVAYPLRDYLAQRAEQATAISEQRALEQEAQAAQIQNEALDDPDYIRAEAKKRLQYVEPGDTVFVYRGPALPDAEPTTVSPEELQLQPWYSSLWDTLSSPDGTDTSADAAATSAPATTAAPEGE